MVHGESRIGRNLSRYVLTELLVMTFWVESCTQDESEEVGYFLFLDFRRPEPRARDRNRATRGGRSTEILIHR